MGNTTDRYFLGVVKLNLPLKVERVELAPLVFVPGYIISIFALAFIAYALYYDPATARPVKGFLRPAREIAVANNIGNDSSTDDIDQMMDAANVSDGFTGEFEYEGDPAEITSDMAEAYEKNNDCIGWLTIDDTVIDYPVMQTLWDEEYYLNRDFNKQSSSAGCLLMDTESVVGTGTKANNYMDGTTPTTNLIIHGHNMRNGTMFGSLDNYKKQSYEKTHSRIKFKSLYEDREYEIVSVFLSQVYLQSQTDVFKYYKFFQANNQEEFDDFYKNIKKLQLYDTGVTASYGDEFITLSVCAYHVEDGRLVVVGKRVK